MLTGFAGLTALRLEFGHADMAFGAGGDREARLQVALRLAPQLLHAAQLRQREQQLRIARLGVEPSFGLLDLPRRAAAAHLAVQRDQILVPLAPERGLQDVEGGVVSAARPDGTGSGA